MLSKSMKTATLRRSCGTEILAFCESIETLSPAAAGGAGQKFAADELTASG
jgi:hypothetical protein